MVAARRSAEAKVTDALADGKRRAGPVGLHALLALQRDAGNAAVGALMAAKQKQPDEASIDAALKEVRRDEPDIDTVEKGLKAAQSAGVPVTLEGPKPPASALAVTTTGFGPNAVQPKKPVPPPKPVPAQSKLGKAGAKPAAKTGGAAAKPVAAPAVPAVAAADPAFMQVTAKVKGFAAAKKAHPPASAKAKEAQDAAVAPTDDLAGQAKASKVDAMDAQQAGSFDKQAFIAAVKTAIEAKSPKTLQDATSPEGKADGVASEVKGMVSQGTQGQAKDVAAATDAPPDQSKAVPKPVTPMAPENPGAAPAIPAAGAAPKPAAPAQTDLSAGKQQVAQEQGDVTDEQLRQSNEPQFQQALDAKQTAAAHASTAPGEFRTQEQQVIGQTKADASAETAAGVAGMQGAKGAALAKLVADKGKTKTKDEAKRAEVTTKVQSIFTATEAEVKKILEGIDPKVDAAFTQGEAQARQAFEAFVAAKVGAYKQDRYSGWLGGFRWAKDKLLGMPDKVNEFYTAGRELYLKQMDGVISRVADIVGNDLSLAKQKIAAGKAEIAAYVKTLSPDLQKVGAEASEEINSRFEQLESDVADKQNSVVDSLASKYVEARAGLDERIEALQAENKGLVDAAIDAVKGVINTIRELAAMLRDVLSRAAGVVGDIIKKPVEFLGNLIAGVKGGILKFKDEIVDHLRKGLMSWLFGALAEAGIELPEKFDLKGIIKLLASIFGLTWSNIRNRLVKQIGEKAMAAAEKGVEIFQVLTSQGVAGLWQMLLEKLGDIKNMILEQVKDFVITKIITAGITWLIGLLNPAAAFIKACKLIYDVVMFFVNNGSRILKFVNTVIDSVADIVRGNVSGVVNKINDVLGQMVPIIIGFLASAIGLGGIGAKIKSIIETLQKPVNKALDWVIKKGLTLAGPIIKGIKGISGKVKAKVAAGKAWVKGKAEAVKDRLTGGKKEPAAPATPANINIEKTFDMDGAGHTLYAKSEGGKLVVQMASARRENLKDLLQYAWNELADRDRSNLPRKGLRKKLEKVSRQLVLAENLEKSPSTHGVKMTAAIEKEINEHIVNAAGLLVDIGREYKMKSLKSLAHGSEWVTAEQELKSNYRGKKFRPEVYGSWNKDNDTRGKNRRAAFDSLRLLVPAASPLASDKKAYFCPHCKQVRLNKKGGAPLTFDHEPSVITHWQTKGGNNMSYDERNAWYNDASAAKLDPMCGPCNSGKGGENEEPNDFKVGPNFRGRGEGKAS
ncbi:hypothetical protein [Lentzea sp. NPDC051838]|uniref:phage tail protein n=1 Tax=Lentzea sp. NPDC051838 TaxID=3154849 RepID=UPI003427A2CE